MIRIENLKKIYDAKKGKPCTALDSVSFELPEKGMVFIVGKSGSGKSTLLNLLGGLDGVSDGDIVVGGKRFSEFSESDYDAYRGSFVGFVFQDFCLIEGMTVFENARLSLDLQGKEADDAVREALKTVDLSEYGSRYPKELSGGQKQRVALARALVKKPKLILADEPTGNLDQRTAKQVLDSLKELSEGHLVVIVSHNADDADKYADRIIELADGRVIRDVTRNEANLPLIEGNKINLPSKRILTAEELESINAISKIGGVEIAQNLDEFLPTEAGTQNDRGEYNPQKSKIRLKKRLFLSNKLSRGNRIQGIFTTIMVSALIILLSACRVFALFDGKALIRESVEADTSYSFTLSKGYRTGSVESPLKTNRLVEVTEEDIQGFYDAGYEGKIYKLYNVTLALDYHGWNTLELGEHINYSESKSPYVNLASGVLECDKSFLDGIYGNENGEIEILAGDLNEATPRAVIITDYFADCILKRQHKITSYQQIVDEIAIGQTKFDVKAIVKTGYAERYAALFAEYERILKLGDERDEAFEKLWKSEDFLAFYDEVKDYLAVGYYFGNDYKEQDVSYIQSRGGTSFDNVYLTVNGNTMQGKQWAYAPAEDVKNGELRISLSLYNDIMGTDYDARQDSDFFQPFYVTITEFPYHTSDCEPVYQKTLYVTGLSYGPVLFSYRDYLELYEKHLYPYSLYFDNSESIANLYMSMESSDFFLSDEFYKTIYTIMDIVAVFDDFFLLLYVSLIAICALLLVSYARRSVKRRMYEIGVLRALGCTNKTVAGVFSGGTIIISVFIAVISLGGVFALDPLMNGMLVENLADMLNIIPLRKVKILKFNFLTAIVDMLTILILSFFSSLGVFLSCRKIKPMNIIRNKE